MHMKRSLTSNFGSFVARASKFPVFKTDSNCNFIGYILITQSLLASTCLYYFDNIFQCFMNFCLTRITDEGSVSEPAY